MATVLKIYSTDTNNNAMTKTVSNANPSASDYVLKHFSQKLVNLSANTFNKVERVDTKDITNADTDTATANWVLRSTSDVFSANSDTYKAAVSELNGVMTVGVHTKDGTTRTTSIDIDNTFKNLKGIVELGKLISTKLTQSINGEVKPLAVATGANGQLAFSNFYSSTVDQVTLTASNQGIIASIGGGLIQPAATADYTVAYENNKITIQKKS